MAVTGVKELEKVLNSLNTKEFLRVQRKALRDSGKILAAQMSANVPFDDESDDDFHLRDAMQVRSEPKRSRTSEVQFRVGPGRETSDPDDRYGKAGYKIKGGLVKDSKAHNYALLLETDNPFMRPAFEAKADEVVSTFRTDLTKSIERIMRREAKAAARKAAS